MKTDKIRVNKSEQQPEGIELEIVIPESDFETQLLTFTIRGYMEAGRTGKKLPYELPAGYAIEHQSGGSFIVTGHVPQGESAYYQPPRPIAVVGVRRVPGGFDIIHADLAPALKQAAQASAVKTDEAPKPD
jgi:hypothetical protein